MKTLTTKTLLISIFTLAIGFNLTAQTIELQKKSSIVIEAGYAIGVDGNNTAGRLLAAQYGKYLKPKFKLAGTVEGIMLNAKDTSSILRSANSLVCGINGFYDLLQYERFKLQVGAGFAYRNWSLSYRTGNGTSFSRGDFELEESSVGTLKENSIGFSFSAGMVMKLSKRLDLTLRGFVQNDNKGHNIGSIRMGLNFNLI